VAVLAAAFVAGGPAGPARAGEGTSTAAPDWQGVSAALDRIVEDKLSENGLQPAPRSDDAEFLRRVTLDLLGTVPTPDEVAAFLADHRPDKRARKIDDLIASGAYAEHQASFWFRTLTGLSVYQGRQREGQGGRYVTGEGGRTFHRWLADQITRNRPYDQMVRDMLTATGRTDQNGAAGYLARWEGNVNNTVGAVAKNFLGVQIQCCQCHDHKYESAWKQKDFKGMAAFFALTSVRRVPEYAQLQRLRREMLGKKGKGAGKAGKQDTPKGKGAGRELQRPGQAGDGMDASGAGRQAMAERLRELRKYANIVDVEDAPPPNARQLERVRKRLTRMKTKRPELKDRVALMDVTPKFWMGDVAADVTGIPRRLLLARWITADDNPYFARELVNRMWGQFMGRGIVQPVDDFNSFQQPSHPEALALLVSDFKAHGYDLQRLQRILLNTATYQRTSRWTAKEQPDPSLFAKAAVRPLDTEQLYFSLVRATGLETALSRLSRRRGQAVQQAIFSKFTFIFDDDEGASQEDFSGSIPEGLFLMNGDLLQRALGGNRPTPARTTRRARRGGRNGRARARRAAGTLLEQLLADTSDDGARVNRLYLRAYGRPPASAERSAAVRFVKHEGSTLSAYQDLFWAILNSAEFMTNH
jgi:hypothetical protein